MDDKDKNKDNQTDNKLDILYHLHQKNCQPIIINILKYLNFTDQNELLKTSKLHHFITKKFIHYYTFKKNCATWIESENLEKAKIDRKPLSSSFHNKNVGFASKLPQESLVLRKLAVDSTSDTIDNTFTKTWIYPEYWGGFG